MEMSAEIEKITQSLPVKLTQEEIIEAAKSLAKTTNENINESKGINE